MAEERFEDRAGEGHYSAGGKSNLDSGHDYAGEGFDPTVRYVMLEHLQEASNTARAARGEPPLNIIPRREVTSHLKINFD